MKCSFIIVAAGSSTRFGKDKQTALFRGMPLFLHSVRAFLPLSEELTVVVPAGREAEFRQLAAAHGIEGITFVAGGEFRSASVQNGLDSLKSQEGFVAIHDAARPLATPEMLQELLETASRTGGAIPGHRVVDTLLRSDDNGIVTEPIPRKNAWAISTPQVFDLKRLREAYRLSGGESFTDDSQVFIHAGGKVALVEEKSANPKITFPGDIRRLEILSSKEEIEQ